MTPEQRVALRQVLEQQRLECVLIIRLAVASAILRESAQDIDSPAQLALR